PLDVLEPVVAEQLTADADAREVLEPRSLGRRLPAPVLPGQQAVHERHVRDERDVELTRERQHVPRSVALQQAVLVLDGGEARLTGGARSVVRLPQLRRAEVAAADRPRLPGLDDL